MVKQSSLKIAISQREETIGKFNYDCLSQNWYRFLNKHQIIPIPNVDDNKEYDFDVLILSGGNCSLSRFHTELKLYNHAVDKNLPIIGICHGAFFIAEINGSICADVKGHKDTEHTINMEDKEFIVNSSHNSKITKLGKNFNIIATDKEYNIEAFKHDKKLIWGMLWHPENMKTSVLPSELHSLLM
jgi:gamma-glutamyl-gamma-aminobutyrate hydrolase PuuD